MLCEVVRSDEGEDMRLEAFDVGVVKTLTVASLMVRFMRSAWLLVHG